MKQPLNFLTVTGIRELTAYLAGATAVAFDVETAPKAAFADNPKAALNAHTGALIGISLAVQPPKDGVAAVYLPLKHKTGNNAEAGVLDFLKTQLFENPDCLKIAHNLAFDCQFLLAAGINPVPPVYDTLAAAQLILKDASHFRRLNEAGLKTLVKEWFGVALPSFKETVGEGHWDACDPADPKIRDYAAADAAYALTLWAFERDWFLKYLPEHGQLAAEIEAPVALYTARMATAGVAFDQHLLSASQATIRKRQAALKQQLEQSGRRVVAVGANAATNDFKAYLFNDLGLPVLKTTATGKASLDNEALAALCDYAREKNPELLSYLGQVSEYRRLGKLYKTYLVGLGEAVNPVSGAIHTRFFPLGTETGRFSSQQPNCQNLPAGAIGGVNVRDLFVARPGKTLVACDYSQIELRIGAWLTGDRALRAVYQNGGDIHASTTAGVYGISLEQAADKTDPLYKERRSVAKNINFGIFYGLYPKGLQRILKLKAGITLSLTACEAMIFNIHRAYPGLAPWQQAVIRRASYDQQIGTALGRKRCLPGLSDPDEVTASHARRAALNHPIQGTAADILKLSMVRLLPLLAKNPAITPLLTVHDELLFEIDDAALTPGIALIKAAMETPPFPGFDLPLAVEVSIGQRYGSLQPYGDAEVAERAA